MIYSLFIGRWQPFHAGHKALIDTVLAEGKNVCIAIRDTQLSAHDPYTPWERRGMIRRAYPNNRRVKIIVIPDIEAVCYGRDVGYDIREIRLGEDTERISGTRIREDQRG